MLSLASEDTPGPDTLCITSWLLELTVTARGLSLLLFPWVSLLNFQLLCSFTRIMNLPVSLLFIVHHQKFYFLKNVLRHGIFYYVYQIKSIPLGRARSSFISVVEVSFMGRTLVTAPQQGTATHFLMSGALYPWVDTIQWWQHLVHLDFSSGDGTSTHEWDGV